MEPLTNHRPATPSFLVDTNVWVDYFVDRSSRHDLAVSFVREAHRSEIPLYTSIESTKDTYFIVAAELKRLERDVSGPVSHSFAAAVNEAAWNCVSSMRRRSTIVGADFSDMIEAIAMRHEHEDYEDNLLLAAALRARTSHIVSSDKQLQAHSPIPCIGLEDAIAIASK